MHIVNADAFAWLEQNADRFDVIVVDSPDPTNVSIGTLCTQSFYRLIEPHLNASGCAVVQTTAPRIARQGLRTVATTIEVAGLATAPYHVHVHVHAHAHAHAPGFGEWGFILACRRGSICRSTWRAC